MTYNDFIQTIIDTRGRFGIPKGVYKERHHILPKCKGGSNTKDNLIDLYPQEHYDAHKMLFEENPEDCELSMAWHMVRFRKTDGVTIEVDKDEFANLREAHSKLLSTKYSGSGGNMYGRKQTEKHRLAMIEANGKISKSEYQKRGQKSAETRKKLGLFSGSKNPASRRVRCIETGQEFSTIKEAREAGYIGNIGKVCMHKLESCGGYHWEYCDSKGIVPCKAIHKGIKKKYHPHKRVKCIETDEIFEHYSDVAKMVGCSENTVRNKCKSGKPLIGYHYISVD